MFRILFLRLCRSDCRRVYVYVVALRYFAYAHLRKTQKLRFLFHVAIDVVMQTPRSSRSRRTPRSSRSRRGRRARAALAAGGAGASLLFSSLLFFSYIFTSLLFSSLLFSLLSSLFSLLSSLFSSLLLSSAHIGDYHAVMFVSLVI